MRSAAPASACRAQSGTLVVAAQMLVGERKDVTRFAADNLATLDPAETRSVLCPARTSRGFCVFVGAAVSWCPPLECQLPRYA
jgi:hypothetical protein